MPYKDPEREKEWRRQNANWLREYRLAYYKAHLIKRVENKECAKELLPKNP